MDASFSTLGAGSVLRTVADGSRDPLIAFDAQYRVTLSNAAATRLIGRSERDVVGHLIWNVALGIHWAGPGTPGAQAACDIVPTGSGLRQETAGQTLRSLRWAVHPFLDEVGRVVGGFCIRHGSDVTTCLLYTSQLALGAGDRHALAGAQADQVGFELGEGGEDVEEHFPHGSAGS